MRIVSCRLWMVTALVVARVAFAAAKDVELVQTLRGHADGLYRVALSPGDAWLATSGVNSAAVLWRRDANPPEPKMLSDGKHRITALAFRPDGLRLAIAGEGATIREWSLPSPAPQRVSGLRAPVRRVAVSPDGRWTATADDGKALTVSDAGWKPAFRVEDLPGVAHVLFFDPSSARIIGWCGERDVRAWRVLGRRQPPPKKEREVTWIPPDASWYYFEGTKAPPPAWTRVDFQPNGWRRGRAGFGYSSNEAELKTVKTRLDQMRGKYTAVFLRGSFEVKDPKRVTQIELQIEIDDGCVVFLNGKEVGRHKVNALPLTYTGNASGGGEPQKLRLDLRPHIGKLRPGQNVLAIRGHNANATSSDFVLTPALMGAERRAPSKPEPPGAEVFRFETPAPIRSVHRAADGTIGVTLVDGQVLSYDAVTGMRTERPPLTIGPGQQAAILADGVVAYLRMDGKVALRRPGESNERAPEGGEKVRALRPLRTGLGFVTGSEGGEVQLWGYREGRLQREFAGLGAAVAALAVSAEESRIAAASMDGEVRIWDLRSGRLVGAGKFASAPAQLAVTDGDLLYATDNKGELLLWSLSAPRMVRRLPGHRGGVHGLCYTPDSGRLVSAGAERVVQVWGAVGDKLLRRSPAQETTIYALAVSEAGDWAASGDYGGDVYLHDLNGNRSRGLRGHKDAVFTLAFDATGKYVYSAGAEKIVRQWDVESGKTVRVYSGHRDWVIGLASAGTDRVLSVDRTGRLLEWQHEKDEPTRDLRLSAGVVVRGVAIDLERGVVATANADGTCRVYRVRR